MSVPAAIWYFKTKSNLRVHSHPSAIFRRWHHQYLLNSYPGCVAVKNRKTNNAIWPPDCDIQILSFTHTNRCHCLKYFFFKQFISRKMFYSFWGYVRWLRRVKLDGSAKKRVAETTVVWEAKLMRWLSIVFYCFDILFKQCWGVLNNKGLN